MATGCGFAWHASYWLGPVQFNFKSSLADVIWLLGSTKRHTFSLLQIVQTGPNLTTTISGFQVEEERKTQGHSTHVAAHKWSIQTTGWLPVESSGFN